jgi:hypothetical protein
MTSAQSAVTSTGAYQHVVVVMSIVLGMTVTQLLKGAAQIYRTRARVRTYWLHWAWTVLLVIFTMFLWWTFWSYRSIEDWTFPRFVLYLSPIILFYFLASLAFPDPSEAVVDLKQYFYANRKGFFGTFAAYVVVAGITAIVIRGLPISDPSNFFRVVIVVLMIAGMRSTSERVHTALFALSATLLLAFIVMFQYRLA